MFLRFVGRAVLGAPCNVPQLLRDDEAAGVALLPAVRRWVAQGGPIQTFKKILGHLSIQTARDIYTHSDLEFLLQKQPPPHRFIIRQGGGFAMYAVSLFRLEVGQEPASLATLSARCSARPDKHLPSGRWG